MRVDEAVQLQQEMTKDLAAIDDVELKAWYVQETQLTPKFKESEVAIQGLTDLATGLQALIDKPSQPETPIQPGVADKDDPWEEKYLSPQERKKASTLSWLGEAINSYDELVDNAQQQTKRSKRDHQQAIARQRFMRQFEHFGEADQHIIQDTTAAAFVAEELAANRLDLLGAFTESGVKYVNGNRLAVMHDPLVLSDLVRYSVTDNAMGDSFNSILGATFQPNAEPEQIIDDEWHWANAALELVGENDVFTNKILVVMEYARTAYAKFAPALGHAHNRRSESAQVSSTEQIVAGDHQAQARLLEPRSVIDQLAVKTLGYSISNVSDKALVGEGMRRSLSYLSKTTGVDQATVKQRLERMFEHIDAPLRFDPIVVRGLASGELIDNGQQIPPDEVRAAIQAEPLFQKRMKNLAPIAHAASLLLTTIKEDALFNSSEQVTVTHTMLAPNIVVSVAVPWKAGHERANHHDIVHSAVAHTATMAADGNLVDSGLSEDGNLLFYTGSMIMQNTDGTETPVAVVLRPSCTADKRNAHPLSQLTWGTASLAEAVDDNRSAQDIVNALGGLKSRILSERNHFVGRTPLHFNVPKHWQEASGMLAVKMRQHEDRQRLLITVEHKDGPIELEFDQNLRILDNRDVKDDKLRATAPIQGTYIQVLLMDMLKEWACAPVVQKPVSVGGTALGGQLGGTNPGHYSYLGINKDGKKSKHTREQAHHFKREQGLDLDVESRRRQPLDPTGQGRNSTYHRENYDPSKPPIVIDYKPNI